MVAQESPAPLLVGRMPRQGQRSFVCPSLAVGADGARRWLPVGNQSCLPFIAKHFRGGWLSPGLSDGVCRHGGLPNYQPPLSSLARIPLGSGSRRSGSLEWLGPKGSPPACRGRSVRRSSASHCHVCHRIGGLFLAVSAAIYYNRFFLGHSHVMELLRE